MWQSLMMIDLSLPCHGLRVAYGCGSATCFIYYIERLRDAYGGDVVAALENPRGPGVGHGTRAAQRP